MRLDGVMVGWGLVILICIDSGWDKLLGVSAVSNMNIILLPIVLVVSVWLCLYI